MNLSNVIDDDYVISVVKKLVSLPSVSGAEDAISSWTAEELRRLGLTVVEQEVAPGRRNVLATLESGRPGPHLLFNGHLDTLPIAEGWSTDPFSPRRQGDRLVGAEINNMKGAVGAMIGCLSALSQVTEHLRGRITLSAVIGECDALGFGTRHMLDQGFTADAAINGEPTDLKVMTNHCGVTQLRLVVRGHGIHVSQRGDGVNAVAKMVGVLAGLNEDIVTFTPHEDFPELPTVNVGLVSGGAMASMLAARAEAMIDVRTVPGMTPDSVLDDLTSLVARLAAEDPTLDADVELLGAPEFIQQHPFQMSADEPVIDAVAAAHAALCGSRPFVGTLFPQVFFGTDASHLARAGIPTAIYGPGKASDINVANESMAIADLLQASRVYLNSSLIICGSRETAGIGKTE